MLPPVPNRPPPSSRTNIWAGRVRRAKDEPTYGAGRHSHQDNARISGLGDDWPKLMELLKRQEVRDTTPSHPDVVLA